MFLLFEGCVGGGVVESFRGGRHQRLGVRQGDVWDWDRVGRLCGLMVEIRVNGFVRIVDQYDLSDVVNKSMPVSNNIKGLFKAVFIY